MSVRTPAWGIYDIFTAACGGQVFASVVSDVQWRTFCEAFGAADLADDPSLATNAQRVAARARLVPEVARRLAGLDKPTLIARLDAAGLPWAEVNSPEAMADDPHLRASGGLLDVSVADGTTAPLPALPLALGGQRPGLRHDTPTIGGDGEAILEEIGYTAAEIAALRDDGVLTVAETRR
jgi:crotonobetainyl-CoA:carnitine CoA-transferase CaiB-like acyl-CoA transferase